MEGLKASDRFAQNQRVNVVGAFNWSLKKFMEKFTFISVDRLQVDHVPHYLKWKNKF